VPAVDLPSGATGQPRVAINAPSNSDTNVVGIEL